MPVTLRPALAVAALALLSACGSGQAAPPIAGQGLQVIELFQSQGCSSCPPANANVMALADRPNVLTLSWQVTYWDHIGWKDTYAKPAYTDRQYAYARALKHNGVWTPQVVINGRGDTVGVNKAELGQALGQFARNGDAIALSLANGKVTASGQTAAAALYVVRYDPRVIQIPIRAGENGGRTLPHRNVVREFAPLGQFTGGTRSWALPASRQVGLKTAILAQAGEAGPIVAAIHD